MSIPRAESADAMRVIRAIARARRRWPDLRLGQLLGNVTPSGRDLYYIEDGELASLIDAYLRRHGGQAG